LSAAAGRRVGTNPCPRRTSATTDSPYTLGATVSPDGVHFNVFSKDANRIDLLLFDSHTSVEASEVIPFDPFEH
jgi:glycogen operon protein